MVLSNGADLVEFALVPSVFELLFDEDDIALLEAEEVGVWRRKIDVGGGPADALKNVDVFFENGGHSVSFALLGDGHRGPVFGQLEIQQLRVLADPFLDVCDGNGPLRRDGIVLMDVHT